MIETINEFIEQDILKIDFEGVKEEIKQYKNMMKMKFKFGKYKDCLIHKKIQEDLDYCIWFYGICYNEKIKKFIKLYIMRYYYPVIKELY